ncbi:hypothetical protein DFJ43DRAFT_1161925 [Lentinula guzmanii]|uniref:Dirigent protein n=1 Tax=Lentinula guzmanii TaxID=2804957 RepID=A0AA38J982_9AGAR|nr:hypothetical protein DFJ43DRAFT_1161925 [Lentinula guzmanii]
MLIGLINVHIDVYFLFFISYIPYPALADDKGEIGIQITGVARGSFGDPTTSSTSNPLRLPEGLMYAGVPERTILLEQMPEEAWVLGDVSFDDESILVAGTEEKVPSVAGGMKGHVKGSGMVRFAISVDIMGRKENVDPATFSP